MNTFYTYEHILKFTTVQAVDMWLVLNYRYLKDLNLSADLVDHRVLSTAFHDQICDVGCHHSSCRLIGHGQVSFVSLKFNSK